MKLEDVNVILSQRKHKSGKSVYFIMTYLFIERLDFGTANCVSQRSYLMNSEQAVLGMGRFQ